MEKLRKTNSFVSDRTNLPSVSLNARIDVTAKDEPLRQILQRLADKYHFTIRFHEAAIRNAGIELDRPTTLMLRNFTVEQSLDRILRRSGLQRSLEGETQVVLPIPPPPPPSLPSLVSLLESRDETQLAEMIRVRLELLLQQRLASVDPLNGISENQKKKLRLAGRGDIQRLVDSALKLKKKWLLLKSDQSKQDEVIREIDRVEQAVNSGPFGHDSLFDKVLKTAPM